MNRNGMFGVGFLVGLGVVGLLAIQGYFLRDIVGGILLLTVQTLVIPILVGVVNRMLFGSKSALGYFYGIGVAAIIATGGKVRFGAYAALLGSAGWYLGWLLATLKLRVRIKLPHHFSSRARSS